MAEQNKTAAPATPKPGDNPKVAAPAGTVPTSMQGATIPHPSKDEPDVSSDTKEMAEARVRALELEEDIEDGADNVAEPEGEPVQCIVKKKFFDERGALIKAGATYFYQERKDEPFPADVLEPVSKAKAAAVKKEHDAYMAEREKAASLKAKRREAFARLAEESEL